jgi:hypothetical protein
VLREVGYRNYQERARLTNNHVLCAST